MPNFGRHVQKLQMGAGVNKSDACCSHRKLINKFLSATGLLPVPVACCRILVRDRRKVCAGHCSPAKASSEVVSQRLNSCMHQFARVVKGMDLRSTARKCAWARTP